jgi:type IV pilus assembly protein PilA
MNKREKGFSLIELLIVVAIILIIAAIAIPNLLRARMAANEASAVGSVRTLNTAQVTYNSTYDDGFAPNLATLGGVPAAAATCNASQLVDAVLAGTSGGGADPSQKSGYFFHVAPGTAVVTVVPNGCGAAGFADGYVVEAYPISTGTTGQRSFCSDASGVIQYDPTGAKPAPGGKATCPALTPLQ